MFSLTGEQETDVGSNKCVYINDENRIDGALYNKSTHLCCMNSVHKKREQGIEVECCGGKFQKFRDRIKANLQNAMCILKKS